MTDFRGSAWPEGPALWRDYASGSLERFGLVTEPWDPGTLKARAALLRRNAPALEKLLRYVEDGLKPGDNRALENIRGLRRPGTVVVAAAIHAALFGGPLSQILKCLTAVKACRELARYSIEAVPLCWVDTDAPSDFSQWEVCLPDHEGDLIRFSLQAHEPAIGAADPLPLDRMELLLGKMENLGRGDFDAETLKSLRSAYGCGATLASATARLFQDWMSPWGAIVIDAGGEDIKAILEEASAALCGRTDKAGMLLRAQALTPAESGYAPTEAGDARPHFPLQNCIFPVAATVLDPFEIHSFVQSLPVFEEIGIAPPLACPQSRAAIVDARSRRTLAAYGLNVRHLFAPESEWKARMEETIPRAAERKLKELSSEVEHRMAELKALIPAEVGSRVKEDSLGRRMLYQIEKLRRRCEQAAERRLLTADRRIRRSRNFLAPGGDFQERRLAGVYFLLRYSPSVLERIHDELEFFQFEPCIISVD